MATWSNGLLHEDYVGQEVHLAWSTDGLHWSEPQVVVHTPLESKIVRNNAGVCSANGLLYCYVGVAKDYGRDITPPGMYSYDKQKIPLDVYVTSDLKNWEHHPGICDNILLVEGPRPSPDGTFMCCGFDMTNMQAVVLAWDDSTRLAMPPRVIRIPPSPEGLLPEEGTWYQTDDGRIWMYQRDFTGSCRLGLTWSDDRGDTWSDLLPTNFPNSLSRAFVGRLPDGRYYIVGNNYDILLNRKHMLIALSDDGYVFNKQYKLIGGNTTRRVNGRHKEDGYHYPNCYAEDDKLFIIYSVNKEDIGLGLSIPASCDIPLLTQSGRIHTLPPVMPRRIVPTTVIFLGILVYALFLGAKNRFRRQFRNQGYSSPNGQIVEGGYPKGGALRHRPLRWAN